MIDQQRVSRVAPLVVIAVSVSVGPLTAASSPATGPANQAARQAAMERLDRLPLLFVPEQVSPDGGMGFAVRGREATIWLGGQRVAYRLHPATEANASSWVVALDLVGATPGVPIGEDPLPTKVSYFKGPKEQWRTGLPSYGSVRYREPWPGVDLVVSGTAGELKSTFVVRPGADPGQIRLAYRGATAVRLDVDGSLVVDTPLGSITEEAPVAYQEIDGGRMEVAAAFELEKGSEPGRQTCRFGLGEYDPGHELVIDPVTLVYCGYIGGSGNDAGEGIAVDASGNAYVTGGTTSTEVSFPVTVGPDPTYNGSRDAFVAKVNAGGTALGYCTYIGGLDSDVGTGIAVDAAGNAYVSGYTWSTEATFPVTVGPDLTYNGVHGGDDAFVAKVNADGTALDYCGYIGGAEHDAAYAIAADAAGGAYVTGMTNSTESSFPVTVGPDLTYNGGSHDAFVAKVNAAGTALEYCGYIGGTGPDSARGIVLDAVGNAFVAGSTSSNQATFPVTVGPDLSFNEVGDAFVAKVNAAGTALDYCGYIGGTGSDSARGIAVDTAGNAYITGVTYTFDATFPVTVGPDLSHNGGYDGDGFVARVNAVGTRLDYCGYIGGSDGDGGAAIAVDALGNAYVTGSTNTSDATFPVTVGPDLTYNGGDERLPTDAFVAKVSSSDFPASYVSVVPAASVAAGAQGAYFQTDIEVNNKGPNHTPVSFQWLPRGQDNSVPIQSAPIVLAPGKSLRYRNVLASAFGLGPDSIGAVAVIAGSAELIGMSRTYNSPDGDAAGTFGQGLPAIRATEMIQGSEPQRIIFLSEDADYRSNVGCVNGSIEPVRINIGLFDAEGTALENKTMDLGPWSNNQINRIFQDYALVNGYVDVWADSDDALYSCYGSLLDNVTSDPMTILPQVPSDVVTFIPAAAFGAGLEGSFFSTDVDLNNVGLTNLKYHFIWLPRGGDNSNVVVSDFYWLAPGASVRYANVLGEVFGLEPDQVGALVVEESEPDLLAMSRTYNLPAGGSAGTSGQELPGIPADRMIPTGVRKRILFLSENDDVRSNVGCINGIATEVLVVIDLFDSDGVKLETKYMALPPYSNRQINGIFRDYAPINGYVDVRTSTPDALIYCYGSVLDNLTSDPTTVLPQ